MNRFVYFFTVIVGMMMTPTTVAFSVPKVCTEGSSVFEYSAFVDEQQP